METQMTEKELQIIKNKYDNGMEKLKRTLIISLILGVIALILPKEVWEFLNLFRKARHGAAPVPTGTMIESIGLFSALTLVLSFIAVANLLIYFGYVHFYKKDLKDKLKIGGEFKVVRIEHLSRKVAEALNGEDTVLHFEPNKQKIKRQNFNKNKKPELLNAKSIAVERAKHSSYEFKSEIIL